MALSRFLERKLHSFVIYFGRLSLEFEQNSSRTFCLPPSTILSSSVTVTESMYLLLLKISESLIVEKDFAVPIVLLLTAVPAIFKICKWRPFQASSFCLKSKLCC